jgi:hypothetical protein
VDNIIYNHLFPCIDNFFDIQVKAQLNNLTALFNSPNLRQIAIQKIYNLQTEIWIPSIPNDINQYLNTLSKPSYLSKSLALINQYIFHIDLTFQTVTLGGTTPIRDYIPSLSTNDITSLRAKRIMFMDQLVTPDGNYLLTWPEIKTYNQNNYKGPKPKWFKNLEENYTLSNLRRLSYPLQDPNILIDRHHKHPIIRAGTTYNGLYIGLITYVKLL